MTEAHEKGNTTVKDLLELPFVKNIVKYTITRNIKADEVNEYYQAILEIGDDISSPAELIDVVFYLEYANWSIAEVKMQRELDQKDRAALAKDAKDNIIDNVTANLRLDRGLIKVGDDHAYELCQMDIVVGGEVRTFTYSEATTLDKDDQKDIDELNRWRHGIIRQHVESPKHEGVRSTGHHQLEVTYLLNRYAAQEVDERGRCGYEKIRQDRNNVFEGIFLPGRLTACTERSRDSVISLLTRKAINPRETSRAWPKRYNGVMRHEAAQKRIREEWEARCEK